MASFGHDAYHRSRSFSSAVVIYNIRGIDPLNIIKSKKSKKKNEIERKRSFRVFEYKVPLDETVNAQRSRLPPRRNIRDRSARDS